MLSGFPDLSITPRADAPSGDSYVLIFDGDRVLLSGNSDAPRLTTLSQLEALLPPDLRLLEFASAGGRSVYCPDPRQSFSIAEADGLCYRGVRSFQDMDEPEASLLTSCYHLWGWYRRNRYCGRCGKSLSPDEHERALTCAGCGNQIFPMIAPAVIVAVTKGDSLLLAQNVHYAHKHHTLIAGYVEVGETLEHAVRREVMEEVGLRLGELRYLGDQPWGLSGSLMFGFQAEVLGDDPIRLQESELSYAAWYPRAELPNDLRKGSIAYALIERFRKGTL